MKKQCDRILLAASRQWQARLKCHAEEMSREAGHTVSVREAIDEILRTYFADLDAKHQITNGPDPTKHIVLWATNRDGLATSLNSVWYRQTGGVPETELGLGCEERVHPDDRLEATETFRQALRNRQALFCEYRLRCAAGHYIRMRSHGAPIYEQNEFVGFVGSALEIYGAKPALRSNTLLTAGIARKAA